MADVFISYSFANKNIADSICHHLEEVGIRCWYAPRDIPHGKDYREAIMEAIENAKCLVLIYTGSSNHSKDVRNEITAAFKAGIPILPFRIEDVEMEPALAYYLNGIHWLDALTPPLENNIHILGQTIQGMLKNDVPNAGAEKAPQANRPISSKRKMWIGALLAVLLLAVSAVLWLWPEKAGKEWNAVKENEVPTFRMRNLSDVGDYWYPFCADRMLSQEMDMYFVMEKESGELALVKTDTGAVIARDISYPYADCDYVFACMVDDLDSIYFAELYSAGVGIRIYDKKSNAWLFEDEIYLTIREDEGILTILYDVDNIKSEGGREDQIVLLIYDEAKGCITRTVTVYPDGTVYEKNISSLGLVSYLAGIDRPGESKVLMLDKNRSLRVFDVDALDTMDISHEEIYRDYIPYVIADSRRLSEDGRYLCLQEATIGGNIKVTISDLSNGKGVYQNTFTENFAAYFCSENELLIFNAEDGTLHIHDLEKGTEELALEEGYFSQTKEFLDIPHAFFYDSTLNVCVFVSTGLGEDGATWVDKLVMTTLDGTVLAQSEEIRNLERDAYIAMASQNGMLFYIEWLVNPEEKADDNISTWIYSTQYSVDKEGNIRFKDPAA